MRQLLAACACVAVVFGAWSLRADEYRYIQEGGATYRERIAKVAVQTPETTCQERQITQLCPRYTTTLQNHTRVAYLPVKEYSWQPRYHGRWNPFVTPGVSYEWKPTTRWVAQTQTYQTPINKREMVPQTVTVRQPTTTWRVVERTQVVERVAIAPGWVPSSDGKTLVAAAPGNSLGMQVPAATSLAPLANAPSLAPLPGGALAAGGVGSPTTSVLTRQPAPPVLAAQPIVTQPPVMVPTAPPANWPPAVPAVARREQIGGISRFESDPPRYGTGVQPNNFR